MKIPFQPNNRILAISDEEEEEPDEERNAMEPELWSKLPEDCMDRVLARLPLPSMFRLRVVCKRWNSFIVSESFFGLQPEISASRSCFLLCTQGRVSCIFNFALQEWHFVPVPRIILPITIPPVSVVSASATLLCYANQVAECSTLFVCNPFTKSLRDIPPMLRVRLIHKLTILADPSTKSYRIIVSGEDGAAGQMLNPHIYKLFTEVYDSRSLSWEMASCPLPDAKFGSDPGVWLEDKATFYCITELPYGVVAFDLSARVWSEVKAEMPYLLGCPSLVAYKRNRLMMIGRVRKGMGAKPGVVVTTTGSGEDDDLCLWELNRGVWVELNRAPVEVCREFLRGLKPRTPLVCAGVGSSVCVTTHLSPRALVVDVGGGGGGWRWLPGDPLFPRLRNFHMLGFCFEPRLDLQP